LARNDDPGAAMLDRTDRDLVAGLPQIELTDPPRPIDRALNVRGGEMIGRTSGR